MSILEFKNVSFRYNPQAEDVLENVSFSLEIGKSYAFVGPTGEGKSTTASLMARLYKPTTGQILFQEKDLQAWEANELYHQIGFILQEPYLFSGTVLDNLIYGNDKLTKYTSPAASTPTVTAGNESNQLNSNLSNSPSESEFLELLTTKGLAKLIEVFPEGLKTVVTNNSDSISLGQKQIINFLRIILREPSFLILDEATANLDTITEKTLQEILDSLPKTTTKMIIAHRLNTIKNVDQVFLVGGGKVKPN